METGNLEFILAWVSILGAVLAAFGFLYREMRRGFTRVDERFARVDEQFDRQDEKFEGLRAVVVALEVSVARIEGHRGIGFPGAGERRTEDKPPERAA